MCCHENQTNIDLTQGALPRPDYGHVSPHEASGADKKSVLIAWLPPHRSVPAEQIPMQNHCSAVDLNRAITLTTEEFH